MESVDSIENLFTSGAEIVAALTLIIGSITAVLRFLVLKPLQLHIKDTVHEATKQIQPGANGGHSLTDLHHKIDGLAERVELIDEKNRQDHEDIYKYLLSNKPSTSRRRVKGSEQ